ncbi:MAG TPA: SIR2 family protein [Nocardioidaceae bacterium]|jgi:hypothetical protein
MSTTSSGAVRTGADGSATALVRRLAVADSVTVSGHLFVLHGDLRRLACDAVVIPCDSGNNVNRDWIELFPTDMVSASPNPRWFRVDVALVNRHARVTEQPTRVDVAATVDYLPDLDLLTRVVSGAVVRAAADIEPHQGRSLPLVGLPLVGTGAGGLRLDRGSVVARLVPELRRVARESGVDIALVMRDARDYAAVQAVRTVEDWPGLDEQRLGTAGELAERAVDGELSLFLGAGVSVPLGLPGWLELLNKLAEDAGMAEVDPHVDLAAAAEPIKAALGAQYHELMRHIFEQHRHAIGHGLLADLDLTRMVTTNYDTCMEVALRGVHGDDRLRVLTRNLASGAQPWLLKLHGDISRPDMEALAVKWAG